MHIWLGCPKISKNWAGKFKLPQFSKREVSNDTTPEFISSDFNLILMGLKEQGDLNFK